MNANAVESISISVHQRPLAVEIKASNTNSLFEFVVVSRYPSAHRQSFIFPSVVTSESSKKAASTTSIVISAFVSLGSLGVYSESAEQILATQK
jgi:hypothetical protein